MLRGHGRGRRLLPQHGALARRCAGRRRGGPAVQSTGRPRRLAARTREASSTVVPAHGLTLEEVGYPRRRAGWRPGRREARAACAASGRSSRHERPLLQLPTRLGRAPSAGAVEVWGHDLELDSASGVFAAGRLDIGTAVLLREARAGGRRRGDLLDLGCGYGVIACGLAAEVPRGATSGPSTSTSGRCSCAATTPTGSASPTGCRRSTPDDVPAELEFAEIWSNPPIRIGKPALHELLLDLAAAAGPGRPGGSGRRQEPRRRLAAALDRRAGLPLRAASPRPRVFASSRSRPTPSPG